MGVSKPLALKELQLDDICKHVWINCEIFIRSSTEWEYFHLLPKFLHIKDTMLTTIPQGNFEEFRLSGKGQDSQNACFK